MEKAKKSSTLQHDAPVKPTSISNTMLLYQEALNEKHNVTINGVVAACQMVNRGLEKIMKRPLNSL
jgi:hypothetical protein